MARSHEPPKLFVCELMEKIMPEKNKKDAVDKSKIREIPQGDPGERKQAEAEDRIADRQNLGDKAR